MSVMKSAAMLPAIRLLILLLRLLKLLVLHRLLMRLVVALVLLLVVALVHRRLLLVLVHQLLAISLHCWIQRHGLTALGRRGLWLGLAGRPGLAGHSQLGKLRSHEITVIWIDDRLA